ncbi:MAG TPA: DUF4350 domain-containing protein [Myxococcota bacterium]|nr:DUF4350 domain-containing protein [Myxococcota bacterium]
MNRWRTLRPWLRGLARLAVLAGLFFLTCEPYEAEYHTGYRGEAASNPYYAAQVLLTRMGMPAESFAHVGALASLPPVSSTVVIPTQRHAVDAATSQRLLDWVDQGGHLVLVMWQLWDDKKRTPDPILDSLGVHQFLNGDDEDDGAGDPPQAEPAPAPDEPEAEAPEDEPDPGAPSPDWSEFDFPDRETPLRVRFDPSYRIELTDEAAASLVMEIGDEENGSHWATLRHGKGLVTALTDDYFMTQPRIGDLDHAELVYRMSRLDGHRGKVWFVYGDQRPSVAQLLWRHGWMVASAGLIVLALWVWSVSRRFGPLAAEAPAERRELMEHVRAAGRLEWRNGAGGALLAAAREALLARLRQRHPGLESLDPAEQARVLEKLSGLPRARVAEALAFAEETDSGRFAGKIAILEKLRRSL